MPYSGASDTSLPSNVKKMPLKKKKAWVSTFNNVYKTCVADGGSQSSCETKAFKIANGNAKKQSLEEPMTNRTLFRRIFEGFLDSLNVPDSEEDFELISRKPKVRSTSMSRVTEQLYSLLREKYDGGDGWAYPMGIYVGDDGSSLFSIVAQSGKLYQVPLAVSKDEVSMGEWVQVKEEFTPVTQSSFSVRRQKKDGKYRWYAIAATSVLNRVGEIDSSTLFDSFIERAEESGEYPRLDFYHYGLSDAEKWEFGTADWLARDGVCYIASGLFDEKHPLAKAVIQSVEVGTFEDWGNSIEFYAIGEPEKVLVDPEVIIPVYKDGKNTRISLVMEKDAAGLFTQMGVKGEVKRAMDKTTKEALKVLFGDDEEGFKKFVEGSDSVNRTVKADNLIHRTKKVKRQEPIEPEEDLEEDEEDQDEEDLDEDTEEETESEIVLDESAVAAIAQQMVQSEEFKKVTQTLDNIQKTLAELVVAREKDIKKIEKLEKGQGAVTQTIEKLSREEEEKKTEYLQDLPASSKRTIVSYRATQAHLVDGDEFEEDLGDIAERTLGQNGLPTY